jgi:pimeloyl-ACP methyl ester carboxylesterase
MEEANGVAHGWLPHRQQLQSPAGRMALLAGHTQPAMRAAMSQARANGLTIEYEEFGERNAPPVLLIMGLGAQMILWHEEFCGQLAARGYRVIRFDNRDVGKSTWLDHLAVPDMMAMVSAALLRQPINAPYLLGDMAADATHLLNDLGIESAHIVGASMGGMIAQSIMSSTGDPNLPPPQPNAISALMGPLPTTREESIERGLTVFRAIGSPGFPFDEAAIRERAALSYDRGLNPSGVMRQMAAILASGSRSEALRSVRAPALVIHGKDDPLVPLAAGKDTAANIPGAELLVIDGMGHDMPRAVWPRLVDAISALIARV